jgi:hypothetical protein
VPPGFAGTAQGKNKPPRQLAHSVRAIYCNDGSGERSFLLGYTPAADHSSLRPLDQIPRKRLGHRRGRVVHGVSHDDEGAIDRAWPDFDQ